MQTNANLFLVSNDAFLTEIFCKKIKLNEKNNK